MRKLTAIILLTPLLVGLAQAKPMKIGNVAEFLKNVKEKEEIIRTKYKGQADVIVKKNKKDIWLIKVNYPEMTRGEIYDHTKMIKHKEKVIHSGLVKQIFKFKDIEVKITFGDPVVTGDKVIFHPPKRIIIRAVKK
ncbi:MAG TPA: hypothetical protein EYP59_03895 [Thiotrichaceae bacterium]|nr:hypothetical protein [Thiotrichaceae bacterium]